MYETRLSWTVRTASVAAVLFLFWDTPVLLPFRVLVIFFHEMFHAAAVFLTGGGVDSIEITLYKTGLTSLYGGIPIFVYSAGYVGTAFLGSVLIVSGHRHPFKRPLYLVVGIVLLLETLLFVRNPFGLAYGWVAGLFFLLLFFKDFRYSAFLTEMVGIMCIVDSLRDLVSFFWYRRGNDAAFLRQLTELPYDFIVMTWLLVSVTFLGLSVAFTLKSISPENLSEQLRFYRPDFIAQMFRRRRGVVKMVKSEGSLERRGKVTVAVYISILAGIVLAILSASRFVLFHPWTAREWVSAAEVKSFIYVVGGRDRTGQIYDQIHRIDLRSRKIKDVARLPSPRFGVGTAAIGDELYILGGFDGKTCFDDILVLDSTKKQLRSAGSLPGPRAFGGTAVLSGKIYYLGGWNGEKQLDEILAIDTAGSDIELIGRLPTPREFVSAAATDDRLYLSGGSDHRGRYLDEVLEIDPGRGTVLRTATLPSPRTRAGAARFQEKIYLAGGWEGNKIEQVLSIDPISRRLTVEKLSELSRGYSDAALVAWFDSLYLIGGTHEKFQRQLSVVEIDPMSGESRSLKLRSFLFW